MSVLNELRNQADMGGPAGALAYELLNIRDSFDRGDLSPEEYNYLLKEIAEVRAQQDLATDEIALRWIVSAATTLASLA